MDPPTLPPGLRPLLNTLHTILKFIPHNPRNNDSSEQVELNSQSYAKLLHQYLVTVSQQLCEIRAQTAYLPKIEVPVDLLDLMDHGGGVNPSLWMLEAARVVKVMEEGVKGRRTVWERVRERMGEDGGGGSALPADDSDSDSDSDDEIPISALAYLADSVDLLALAYHNVLVMLRDYGSQMISEGAVQDGRRIRGEMEGGGKKRKRGEEEDVAVTGSKETEFVEKAVTMIKEGEAKVLRGLAMVKEKYTLDFKQEVKEIEMLQTDIDELEKKLKEVKERGKKVAAETEDILGRLIGDQINA